MIPRALGPVLAALALGLAATGYFTRSAPEPRFAVPALPDPALPAHFETVFTHAARGGVVEAPAIIPGDTDGAFALVWHARGAEQFLGQDSTDRIAGVTLPEGGLPAEVMTTGSLSRSLTPPQTVLKLSAAMGDGAGGLLVTTTVPGAPRFASLVHAPGQDGLLGAARRLSLSPLFGRGVAAGGPVVPRAGGGHLLPVTSSLGRSDARLASLDAGGRVRGLTRLRGRQPEVTPVVVPLGATDAVALTASNTGALLLRSTSDGGQAWSAPQIADLPGAAGPLAAAPLSGGRVLVVSSGGPGQTGGLQFAISSDRGKRWVPGPRIGAVDGGTTGRPALAVLRDGRLVLAYAAGGGAQIIAHVFTERWATGP